MLYIYAYICIVDIGPVEIGEGNKDVKSYDHKDNDDAKVDDNDRHKDKVLLEKHTYTVGSCELDHL